MVKCDLHIRTALFALLIASTMAQARQDQPTTARVRAAEGSQLVVEREAAGLPSVQVEHMAEVVKLAVESDLLTARTSPAQLGTQLRVIVPGTTGVIRLSVSDSQDDAGKGFSLIWDDPARNALPQVITQMSAGDGRLMIARGSDSDRGISNVQYIQVAPQMIDATGGDQPVKLYVQVTRPDNATPVVDLKLSAASFTELRRKYPRQVNEYLRPILRDFGQEQAVFGADVRAQWQVLSADLRPDDATIAKVNAVVTKFDSANYLEREHAAAELQALGQPAAVALARMDRSKFSAEQNSGVDTFLAPYLPLGADDVQRLRNSVDFLLDCAYSDDEVLRGLAIARLETIAGRSLHLDAAASPDARAAAIERVRRELTSGTANAPTSQP